MTPADTFPLLDASDPDVVVLPLPELPLFPLLEFPPLPLDVVPPFTVDPDPLPFVAVDVPCTDVMVTEPLRKTVSPFELVVAVTDGSPAMLMTADGAPDNVAPGETDPPEESPPTTLEPPTMSLELPLPLPAPADAVCVEPGAVVLKLPDTEEPPPPEPLLSDEPPPFSSPDPFPEEPEFPDEEPEPPDEESVGLLDDPVCVAAPPFPPLLLPPLPFVEPEFAVVVA